MGDVSDSRREEIMDYETWANFGPEEDECADDGCQCDKCNGEPEFKENEKPREGRNEPWVGA